MEPTASQAGAGAGLFLFIQLALIVFIVVTMWKIFTKAGKPGWACIIPIYNIFVLLDIAGKPAWWFILFLIPVVNLIVMILVLAGLAANFGKGGGFVVGLIFLPIIFYPILAFGSAQYKVAPPANP
jgi:hypothetical protein